MNEEQIQKDRYDAKDPVVFDEKRTEGDHCSVETCQQWEMEKHPWLSKGQARRIVEDNLSEDPGFYDFLEHDLENDFESEVEEEEDMPKKPNATMIEISFGREEKEEL